MRWLGFILKNKLFISKYIALITISSVMSVSSVFAQDYEITNQPILKPKVLPNETFDNNVESRELPQGYGGNAKIEVYTDENGNSVSKEQEERIKSLKKLYKKVTKEEKIYDALELMKGGLADFSREAILGNNLTGKPMNVAFEDLSKFGEMYANFDALGWKKKERLYIYINEKHQDAPPEALAAVLAHEALHQDEFNSLNEETYAWTLEAAVWTQLTKNNPQVSDGMHPLIVRENTLKKLFVKGNYTNKYIRKTVISNPGYANLPSRSPGFEDDTL